MSDYFGNNTHITIKDNSIEELQKRIEEMYKRNYVLDSDIVENHGHYGVIYYAKLKHVSI